MNHYTSYVLLIKNWKDGTYEYPNIEQGWYTFKTVTYYCFDKNELYKFNNIKYDKRNTIELNLYDYGIVVFEDKPIEVIKNRIGINKQKKTKLCFIIQPISKNKTIRFFIFRDKQISKKPNELYPKNWTLS
jgi:hypothetical protein